MADVVFWGVHNSGVTEDLVILNLAGTGQMMIGCCEYFRQTAVFGHSNATRTALGVCCSGNSELFYHGL